MRALAIALALASGLAPTSRVSGQMADALVHIELVADRYFDTPDGRGLLPTALAEAEIALEYARLAGADSTSLSAMRRYAGYVLHAVDPTMAPSGPGLGYGVRSATSAVLRELELALAFDSLSDNMRLHGGHAATAASNVLRWTDEVVSLASQVQGASDPAQAAATANRLERATDGMLRGVDGNGDGRRGWPDGDEGLQQASYHITLLKRGEGLGG